MSPSPGAEPEEFDPYALDDDDSAESPPRPATAPRWPPTTSPPEAPRSPPDHPREPSRFDVRDLADLYANPPPRKPWIIEGLLRPSDRMVVVAPRNLGKSWLMLQLAHAVAAGEGPFLGPSGFEVQQPTCVFAILGETDHEALHDRIRTQGYGPPTPGTIYYNANGDTYVSVETEYETLSRNGREIRRQRAIADLPLGLEQCIVEKGVGLLVIDPWAAFYRGDENSNEQVQRALAEIDGLIARTGIAVAITHHPAKSTGSQNSSPEDTWRGASRFADWATTRITIAEHHKPSEAKKLGLSRRDARRHVDVSVLTRGEPIDDFSMQADPVNRRWSAVPTTSRPTRSKVSPQEAARACQEAGGFPSTKAAAEALGVAQGTAQVAFEGAEREGLVKHGRGPRGAVTWTPA